MNHDQQATEVRDFAELMRARANELDAEAALVRHLEQRGPWGQGTDERADELRRAHAALAQARATLERGAQQQALDEAAKGAAQMTFRWGFAQVSALLWLCSCGKQITTINPQLKQAWDQGARPQVLERCPSCGALAKLTESSIHLASAHHAAKVR